MYKYVLNSVVKMSTMFAQYFDYYAIILRGAVFSSTRCIFFFKFITVLTQGNLRLHFACIIHSHHPLADPICSVSVGMILSAARHYWRLNNPFAANALQCIVKWGRKPPKLPLPLWISSLCRRMTEPWP